MSTDGTDVLIREERLAYCNSPLGTAAMKCSPEDFRVVEVLGFGPSGEGQHQLLQVEKRGVTTPDLIDTLAKRGQFSPRAIGYCGLKDRHAVTTQWISVDLAGRALPDWQVLLPDGARVLAQGRHHRKLRVGSHRSNQFVIKLRHCDADERAIAGRLDTIEQRGVPNYFGPQRFGRDYRNVEAAARMFAGRRAQSRRLRGLYLSTARAMLFNRVLDERVRRRTWDKPLTGDLMLLEGSRSFFQVFALDAEVQARVERFDIHPSGPLWGDGGSSVSDEALAAEKTALKDAAFWCEALQAARVATERRALRAKVTELRMRTDGASLVLEFELARGCFATSVVRELFSV